MATGPGGTERDGLQPDETSGWGTNSQPGRQAASVEAMKEWFFILLARMMKDRRGGDMG